jgi:c-di-GMP-binding flagellar brake protein YcgR
MGTKQASKVSVQIDADNLSAASVENDVPIAWERRRNLRVRPDALSAVMTVGIARHVVSIRDISTGGAKVVNAPQGLQREDRVGLLARLDEEMIDMRCRVAYVNEDPIRGSVGVEFLDVDSESTTKLLSYVCKLGMEVIRR